LKQEFGRDRNDIRTGQWSHPSSGRISLAG
jgi:hypothetical protein